MPKYPDPPGFAEWESQISASLREDPLWRTPAYRFAAWLSDLARIDMAPLWRDPETTDIADQLLRAVRGISSTLAEGYGRTTGPERARYYDYAASSTREARDWYFKARHYLPADVVEQRFDLLLRILRILSAVIPRERGDAIGRARRTRARRRDSQVRRESEG